MEGRLIEVTQILLESEREITVKQISKLMEVSEKTVRNYLEKIEETLLSYNLMLDKVPGVGIILNGTESDKIRLKNILNKNVFEEEISPQHRQETIIITILMNSNKYSIDKLAYRLHVSSSTVYKDLTEIEKLLDKQDLVLVNRNGKLSIEGNENNIRKVLSRFIFQNKSNLVDVNDISNISDSTFEWVQNNFGFNYNSIEKFLKDLERILNATFNEDVFTSLILHLSVSLYRVQHGKTVELPTRIVESIRKSPDYEIVKDQTTKFYQKFNLEISEQEILYITLHIITNRNYSTISSYTHLFGEDENVDISVAVAREIASISSKSLDLDLNNDEIFFNSLVLHLIPTITRLKSNLSLKNPILQEIKSKYTETFGLAWMSCLIVEKNLGVRIPESEIGYIAIHIGAAIERNKRKIKTKILSNSGYGIEQFIVQKLKQEFIELDIIEVDSKDQDVDLIISTTNIVNSDIVTISPSLVESDFERIRKFIDEFYIGDAKDKKIHQKLFFNDNGRDKTTVLNNMCQYVVNEGFVTKKYAKTVFDREEALPTEVGNLVAIPHGASTEVLESCVVLTVLKDDVDWENARAKYILLVSLSDKDLKLGKDIFSNLSNLMTTQSFYNNLKKNEETCQREFDKLLEIHR